MIRQKQPSLFKIKSSLCGISSALSKSSNSNTNVDSSGENSRLPQKIPEEPPNASLSCNTLPSLSVKSQSRYIFFVSVAKLKRPSSRVSSFTLLSGPLKSCKKELLTILPPPSQYYKVVNVSQCSYVSWTFTVVYKLETSVLS